MSTIEDLINNKNLAEELSLDLNRIRIDNEPTQIIEDIKTSFEKKGVVIDYINPENMRYYFEEISGENIFNSKTIFSQLRGGDLFMINNDVYIPLKVDNQNMGTFKLENILKDQHTVSDLKIRENLSLIKNQMKQILYGPFNKNKVDKLIQIAYTDKLTSLGNKILFDKEFSNIISDAKKDGSDFSFIYMDINRFKSINDHYGHLHGDDILAQFGQIVLSELYRPKDQAYRTGGEEFCVLLPNTGSDGGKIFAERLYHSIESHKFTDHRINRTLVNNHTEPYPYEPTNITVSIGVSSFPDTTADPEDVYGDADTALSMAKTIQRKRERVLKNKGIEEYRMLNTPIILYS